MPKKPTLSDVAKAAGVSISTVSKVINNDAEKIPQATQERVLQCAEQLGYAVARNAPPEATIGVMLPNNTSPFYGRLLELLSTELAGHELAAVVRFTGYSEKKEHEALQYFHKQRLKVVLLFPKSEATAKNAIRTLSQAKLIITGNMSGKIENVARLNLDISSASENATEFLIMREAERIGVLLQKGGDYLETELLRGYKRALIGSGRSFDPALVTYTSDKVEDDLRKLLYNGIDAILCQNTACAEKVYRAAEKSYFGIANDLSVVSLEYPVDNQCFSPPLCAVDFPIDEYAKKIVELAKGALGGNIPASTPIQSFKGTLKEGESVYKPPVKSEGRILVIGRMNMDISMRVNHKPDVGKAAHATDPTNLPGGKGANQAVGVAKLGGNACMIGLLGNDLNGKLLHEGMRRAGVDMHGVETVDSQPTGMAFVQILPDGNSLIVGAGCANDLLDSNYVEKYRDLFAQAKYCLYQMESDEQTLRTILSLCSEQGVRAILKPHEHMSLPRDLYGEPFAIVPNRRELDDMLPGPASVEEKAKILVRQGIENVVVTLGAEGCLWAAEGILEKWPATRTECVDATGASDVFISCLAVMLQDGKPMSQAVRMANYAAGFSVMWWGAQNAVPDKWMVESQYDAVK